MVNINIIYPKDNWILQQIGLELLKAKSDNLEIIGSQEMDVNCSINYYINWCYWKILYPELPKSKFDIVLFTHIDEKSPDYLDVLTKADLIVCMSPHGKLQLLKLGIVEGKIDICPYWGVSISTKKKIVIGTSGRNRERKNMAEVEQLKQELDSNFFEFIHSVNTNDKFFSGIDYYLQASTAEGGSMDILNAIYSRTPVVSRNIGFIFGNTTPSDFIYENYNELLFYFKGLEQDFINKDIITKEQTWNNFRKWHVDLFTKELDDKKN